MVKNHACQCRKGRFDPWVGKIPWTRAWQPTPAFLPEKSYGQRSLMGYSPWGLKESDTTEHGTATYRACIILSSQNYITGSIELAHLKYKKTEG